MHNVHDYVISSFSVPIFDFGFELHPMLSKAEIPIAFVDLFKRHIILFSVVTSPSWSTQISIATSFKYLTPTESVMSFSISTSTGFFSSRTTTSSLSPTTSTNSFPAVSSYRLPSSPSLTEKQTTVSPTYEPLSLTTSSSSKTTTSSLAPTARTSSVPVVSSTRLPPSSSPTEKQKTVSPTYESPPTPVPTECRAGTCRNGGTCIIPGYFCRCTKYYVWRLCTIYVGELNKQKQN